MDLATLRLERAARPSADGLKTIRDHPAFCYVCTNFDYEVASCFLEGEGLWIDKRSHSVTRTSTMVELADAAAEGCASCKVLKIVAEHLASDTFDPESEDELTITYWLGTTLTFQLGDYTSKDHVFELFTLPGARTLWPSIGNDVVAVDPASETWEVYGGQASPVPQDPLSDVCMSKVSEWRARCRKDHPYCQAAQQTEGHQITSRYCPKRLIDVGLNGGETRLITTNGASVEYIALSYCWGNAQGLNLEKANEDPFCQRLPVSKLLKTHQDAITLTRKLGVQYLWTDALCIRQDDNDEKAIEIANMDSVYAGAYLTIAGTSARRGDQGCLTPRAETYRLPIIDQHGDEFQIFVRRSIPHAAWDFNVTDAFSTAARYLYKTDPNIMAQYPLFDRGWCFQERLLSRRTIHFTSHEIVWECLGMTCCECGTMDDFVGTRTLNERRFALGVPHDIEVKNGKLERSRKLAARMGLLEYGAEPRSLTSAMRNDHALMNAITGRQYDAEDPSVERTKRWRDLIAQYSRRVLSFDSDALPAVSGLAKAWVANVKEHPRYLAGIWEDDLLRSVLWKCLEEEAKPRPQKYLAPSWSWVSVRRVVDFLHADTIEKQPIYHVTIEKAECETSTINPYGEVASGSLIVTGQLVKAKVAGGDDRGMYVRASATLSASYVIADCIHEAQSLLDEDIYCLWWSTDVNDTRTGSGWERALALKQDNYAPDTFSRVGIFEHFHADEWKDLLEQRTLTIV